MHKQIPGKLLATVAASAASVTPFAAVDAVAQDNGQAAIDSRINFAFEGAALWGNYNEDKLGSLDKLGDNSGDLRGTLEVSRRYDTDLDWRLAGTFHVGPSNDINFGIVSDPTMIDFGIESGYNFQTLDFDLGKHVSYGNTNIRWFGGLRVLHSHERTEFGVVDDSSDPLDKTGTIDKVGTSTFWGVGPRVGAEAYYEMGSNWGLTGSVSGSAMWGRKTQEMELEADFWDPGNPPGDEEEYTYFNYSASSFEVVTNVEASAGVNWQFMPGKSLTAGYRIESWNNMLSMSGGEGDVFHGPFLRVDVKM